MYDFRSARQAVAEFIVKEARRINIFALDGRHDRVKSLQSVLDTGRDDEEKVLELINLLTEHLCQHLIAAAAVMHFKSLPADLDNGLYRFGADLLIRPVASWRSDEELALAVLRHMPLNEELEGWFDPLIKYFRRCFFVNINPWATVDYEIRRNTLTVTLGEDLRHVIFRREHGTERWTGDPVLPGAD